MKHHIPTFSSKEKKGSERSSNSLLRSPICHSNTIISPFETKPTPNPTRFGVVETVCCHCEMGKSTSSLLFICNRLIIRVSLPFRAFTSHFCSTIRENAKTLNQKRNQFLNSMRDHCKSRTFKNLDHALGLFDTTLHMHPLPSIINFNRMLGAVARMELHCHYSNSMNIIIRNLSRCFYSQCFD